MLSLALREPEVRDQQWTWTQENFPAIVDRIPTQWRRYTPGMARTFCEQDKLTELIEVFDKHSDLTPGFQRSLDQTEEQIRLCIAQREQGSKLASAMAFSAASD